MPLLLELVARARICRGFRLRLSVRLNSVRRLADPACRRAGSSQRRLGQYRRDQCVAHRPQGARRRDARRRHSQGHRRGGDHHCRCLAATRRCAPRSAPSSAICFRSGSVLGAAKASRPISVSCSASACGSRLLAFCLIWLAVAAATRYSSLAALIASAATPAVLWWNGDRPEAKLFLLLAALLWIMHRANIARLIGGTESRIGGRSEG